MVPGARLPSTVPLFLESTTAVLVTAATVTTPPTTVQNHQRL